MAFIKLFHKVTTKIKGGMIFLRRAGIAPLNLKLLPEFPKFIKNLVEFKKLGGQVSKYYPVLDDRLEPAGIAKGQYFHQDLLVANFIYLQNPIRHIDIGSRIDGFVAHVASYRVIEVFDIRDLPISEHSNLKFNQVNILEVNSNLNEEITDSISCLHTLEHIGLGRYGDPIDPNGSRLAFLKICKMVKPGGLIYLSVPISLENRVEFNAHRFFKVGELLQWCPPNIKLTRFDYVDNENNLYMNMDVSKLEFPNKIALGIYTFQKL